MTQRYRFLQLFRNHGKSVALLAKATFAARLGATAIILALIALYAPASSAQTFGCSPAMVNDIVCENSKAGNPSSDWSISDVGDLTIQGFTTDISVNQGGTVYFKVKTNAAAYHLNIFRMGYYGGNGARKITTVLPSATLPQTQPACLVDAPTNLSDCGNWNISASWQVPANATSGLYFAVATRDDTGGVSQIFFIVRNDSSHSDVLYQTSDTTWQAYNDYGGHSLYGTAGQFDIPNRAFKVSYNRPFDTRNFEAATFLFNAEYPMIRWLEANGYDVTYFTGIDAARNGGTIQNHKMFLSSGHDEYWSGPQRTNVEAARDAGVNMAFFSGNEIFWKIRFENSLDPSATAYRTIACYKETLDNAVTDPKDPPTWTGTWRDTRFSPPADGGRPENSLSGTLFLVNGPGTDNMGLSIKVPNTYSKLRFWRNTSIANLGAGQTTTLPSGTLGYEWDADVDNGSRPAGLIDMSAATYNLTTDLLLDFGGTYGGGTATHHLTQYRAPSGALVFGAGTVQWAYGLDANHDSPNSYPQPADVSMQQATVNLFADMSVQAGTLQPGLTAASASNDTKPPTSVITSPASGATVQLGSTVVITGTASDTGGGVVATVEVSVDGGQTWHPATGTTSWNYSWTSTTDGTVTIKSRAADDSSNLESAGSGVTVTVPKPQIGVDTQVNTNGSAAATTVKSPAISTGGVNELLLAFISADYLGGTNTTVTGVTGAGLTWTLVVRSNAQSGSSEIWRAFATAPLSGATVTATLSQSVISSITVASFSGVNTSGVNGAGAIGATKAAAASGGAPSATLVTTQSNSLIFGVGNDFDNAIARTPATGQSLVSQYLTPTGDTYWTQRQNVPVVLKGTSVSINDTAPTGDRYNLAIAEILASATPTYALSGNISPVNLGAGTSVSLSGPVNANTTADGSGNFSFSNLPNGSYTVTPNSSTNSFTPPNQTVSIGGSSVTGVNFAAAVIPTFAVSGSISPAVSGSGATVTLPPTGEGGKTLSAVADASGNYSFPQVVDGSYKITPSKSGFTFSPAQQTIAVMDAGVAGINFTATSTAIWTISGILSPSSLTSGALVTLSGPSSATVNADSSGHYSFPNLNDGSYTVAPSKIGVAFTPTSSGVTVADADVPNTNFSGVSNVTYTISGNISPAASGNGATVTLSGAANSSTTADASGNFTFSNLANGSYSVAPAKSGFTFTPANQPAVINNANVTAVNFTIQAVPTYSLSGSISPASLGSGAKVSLTGSASASTTADGSGNFTFSSLANGSYTLTPSKSGLTFTPANLNAAVSNSNVSGLNFSVVTYSISGVISPAASGSGSTVTLTGAANSTTTADASGNYSFSGLLNGSYTITPSKSRFAFNPANQVITIAGANQSAVNFASQTSTGGSIAADVTISKDQSSASATVTTPGFSTTVGNELLLAFIATDDPGSGTNIVVNNVTGGGLAWALVVRSNTQRGTSEIWRAFAPSTLAGASVTATLSKSVTSSLTIVTYSGVDTSGTNGSGAIGATSTGNSAGGAPTAKLTTTRNNSLVLGVGNDYDNAKARTLGPSQTLIHQYLSPSGDTYWSQRQTSLTLFSGTSVTINDTAPTADRFDVAICEVFPAP